MSHPRTYHSPARAESARQTRRRIVGAARELFESRGYAGTTIDAVAEAAGVSRRTVFLSVGSKAELLKTAWDWGVVGDDEPVPMAERPHVLAMLQITDPAELVRLWVGQVLGVAERLVPLETVLNRAVDADADAAALRARIDVERQGGARMFVTHLESVGGLREGLTVDAGADICWVLMNPLLQARLRTDRGWTREAVADWLVRMTAASLLPGPS
jgi:TetR/AcrR family transcriptional regulator, regulator of autoinduction and epiphytic fitness